MADVRLVLASSSPRRAAYLKELGYPFRKVVPRIDESVLPGESPRRYVRRLAVAKAESVARRNADRWIVAADTAVVVDGEMLGKPAHAAEAKRMLRRLAGRAHHVLSALALVRRRDDFSEARVASTKVAFRPMTEQEIRWYVASGECLDKAGAYAIQGKGGLFVERIDGSFSNVVGFPVETFYELALRAGLPLPKPGSGR